MARISMTGADDVIAQLRQLGEEAREVAPRMVSAGAGELRKAWTASAERHGHRDTGDLIASIAQSAPDTSNPDAVSAEVYPRGKDRKGVRNATKAFVLHYGSSRVKGSHWVDDAESAAQAPADAAMEKVWDDFIQSRS